MLQDKPYFLVNILSAYRSCKPPVVWLLETLPPLQPRYYSACRCGSHCVCPCLWPHGWSVCSRSMLARCTSRSTLSAVLMSDQGPSMLTGLTCRVSLSLLLTLHSPGISTTRLDAACKSICAQTSATEATKQWIKRPATHARATGGLTQGSLSSAQSARLLRECYVTLDSPHAEIIASPCSSRVRVNTHHHGVRGHRRRSVHWLPGASVLVPFSVQEVTDVFQAEAEAGAWRPGIRRNTALLRMSQSQQRFPLQVGRFLVVLCPHTATEMQWTGMLQMER